MPIRRSVARRPIRRRRILKKKGPYKRPLRAKMYKNVGNGNKDYATVTEVTERVVGGDEGNFITHCLADFARARTVAKQFRFYRCKKVEIEFVPYANVFAPGTAFPELFTQVDRTGGVINGAALPLPTKQSMEAKGCLPQKMTSIIKKFYTPSVLRNENLFVQYGIDLSGGLQNSRVRNIQAVSSTPVFNKWYMVQHYPAPLTGSQFQPANYPQQIGPAVDSMSLQWYGMNYFVSQPLAPQSVVGKIIIKVHWQFKQPLWPSDLGISGGYQTGGEGWEDNGVSPNNPNVNNVVT